MYDRSEHDYHKTLFFFLSTKCWNVLQVSCGILQPGLCQSWVVYLLTTPVSFHLIFFSGKKVWTKTKRCTSYISEDASTVSISDEAFLLLCLDNYWDRWMREASDLDCTTHTPAKFTDSRKGRHHFGGWNVQGLNRFNILYDLVKQDRQRDMEKGGQAESELLYTMKSIHEINSIGYNNRKRDRYRPESLVTVCDDLNTSPGPARKVFKEVRDDTNDYSVPHRKVIKEEP
jgi:hypothetical protein